MADTEQNNASHEIYNPSSQNQKTEEPLSYLFDVEPNWAFEYLRLSQNFNHFPFMNDIVHVSPRVVKIAILKPESLIRLLDAKWHDEDPIQDDSGATTTWAKYRKEAMERWDIPAVDEWDVAELEEAAECFHEGMTPMEAMIDIHSDCADGDENLTLGRPTTKVISMILILAAIIWAIYNSVCFGTATI